MQFRYFNSPNPAILDVSIELYPKEVVCITGKSGGGKSTLALAMCGFIPHNIAGEMKGEVFLKGYSSRSLTVTEISQFIGLVQQDPENQIVTSTVYDEIAFGLENICMPKEEIQQRITESSNALNISDLLIRSTTDLSGGEKQLVAIASILAMQPNIIVMDECTAFLDEDNVNRFIGILKDLNDQGITIVLIDHQPWRFKEIIDRYIILDDGKIMGSYTKYQLPLKALMIPKNKLLNIQSLPIKSENIILRVNGISVQLRNRKIIQDLSSKFREGGIYGISGPNGSGKTTLLRTILNLIKYNGEIFLKNASTKKSPTHILAKRIGYVFQNPHHQLFEDTVRKEVQFAPRNFNLNMEEINIKIENLLEFTLLSQYLDYPPFSLSYGQKRRLNICSVEIYSPSILLLDEPFVALDKENIEILLELLKYRKQQGKTTIIVSHRKELLDLADFIFYLNDGRIEKEWDSKKKHEVS